MRFKYRFVCSAALILAGAAARAEDPELQKRGQTLPAAPVSRSDAPGLDLESQKPRRSLPVVPGSPTVALRTDLEALKNGVPPPTSPASRADAPSGDLEKLKQPDQISVTTAAARSLAEKTQRVSQTAIEAIPLKRTSDSYGSSIPPIRVLTPAGRL